MTRVLFYTQKYSLVILLSASALAFNPWMNTDVFEFPKLLFLIIFNGIFTISTIINIYTQNGHKNSPRKISTKTWLLILLISGNILAYIFSVDQKISLIGSAERFQGFLTNINYILLGLNSYYFFSKNTQEETNGIFKWLIGILIFGCLLAIGPYLLPLTFPFYFFTPAFFYNRVFGTFGNPNYLAAFIITVLPFLILNFNKSTIFKKIIYIIFLTIVISTLFLTGSRSAWLAVILGFLTLGIIKAIKEKKYKALIISAITIFILTSIITIKTFNFSNPENYYEKNTPTERLAITKTNLTSIKTRFYLWKTGLQTYLKRPLTGYGHDALRNKMEPYLPYYLQANEEFYIDRTHNEFLDILLQQGPLTLIGYLGLLLFTILFTLKKYFKTKNITLYEMTAFTSMIILIIFHFFNFSTISTSILIYFLAAYLMAINHKNFIDIKRNHA